MNDSVPMVVVGNSLAGMVAATRLADEGAQVTVINSSKNWGGHFTTITSNGARFDPGMVLHEFTSFSPQCGAAELQSYDPSVRNDVGRFFEVVKDYISRYQRSTAIQAPNMFVGGAFFDDILIANSLQTLKLLPFAGAIASDLSALEVRSPLHASQKHRNHDFAHFDFEAVSLANHGKTLHHQIIEPYCRKLLDVSTRDIQALYHRVAWLPLYYPETLLSYMTNSPQALASTIFSYPVGDCVGDLARKLQDTISADSRISVVTEQPVRLTQCKNESFEIAFENREAIRTNRLAWGNPLTDLARLLGIPIHGEYERCSIALAFAQIPSHDIRRSFTALALVDPEFGIYRVTNQSICAGLDEPLTRLVIECNPDYIHTVSSNETDIESRLFEELGAVGITAVRSAQCKVQVRQMNNAITLPTKANCDHINKELAAVKAAAPAIATVGPASGLFSSSFNDQIVQGLRLASKWG